MYNIYGERERERLRIKQEEEEKGRQCNNEWITRREGLGWVSSRKEW